MIARVGKNNCNAMLVLKQNRPINGINKKEDTMTKDHMYVGCFII